MAKPLFDSLEIRQFRAFDFLEIERLGHVNLIIGKNNVGKSTLLEALYLYANMGSPIILSEILTGRDMPCHKGSSQNDEPVLWHIFHGHKQLQEVSNFIQIGRSNAPDSALRYSIGRSRPKNETYIEMVRLNRQPIENTDSFTPVLTIALGDFQFFINLEESLDATYRKWNNLNDTSFFSCNFIHPNGITPSQTQMLWDRIGLRPEKQDVIEALRIIEPDIEDIALFAPRPDIKAFHLRLRGQNDPIPARSLGDGINRLIGLSMTLACCKDGILLVDEIENGIHWSVMPDVWKFIVKVAKRLNVQVFATTHSNDCLKAFHFGTKSDPDMEGVAVRLEKRDGEYNAEIFNEQRLAVIVKEGIEIR